MEGGTLIATVQIMKQHWKDILDHQAYKVACGKWVEIFSSESDTKPTTIYLAFVDFKPYFCLYNVEIPAKTTIHVSNDESSSYFRPMAEETLNLSTALNSNCKDLINKYSGIVRRERVV